MARALDGPIPLSSLTRVSASATLILTVAACSALATACVSGCAYAVDASGSASIAVNSNEARFFFIVILSLSIRQTGVIHADHPVSFCNANVSALQKAPMKIVHVWVVSDFITKL